MRRALVILVAVFTILLFAAVVFAQNSPNAESQALSELNAVQSERNAALERGDLARVRSFYASHFMIRIGGGRALTLDDLAKLEKLAAASEILERKHSTIIQRFKLVGIDAVLTAEHSASETHRLKDGSILQMIHVLRRQEQWIKQGSDWKLSVFEDMEEKRRDVTINGQKAKGFVPEHAVPIEPNTEDKHLLNQGYGLIFIYRMNDGGIIKAPIFCNGVKLARMTGGSFVKIKLQPGNYFLRSEKGDPIDAVVKAGDILLLVMKMEAGFPKGRGNLRIDPTVASAQAYKLPRLLGLTPLGSDNIDDVSKVIVAQQ